MFKTISEIIIHAGIIQGVFTAFVIWKMKNRFYSLQIPLILCVTLIIAHNFYLGSQAAEIFESPFILAEPFIFLIGPLLFFHLRYIAYHQKLSWEDSSHIVPFLLFFLTFIPGLSHGKQTVYYGFLHNNSLAVTALLWILMASQMIFYWHRMSSVNKDYKKKLGDELSQIESYDTSWIRTFTILFLITFTVVAIVLVFIVRNDNLDKFQIPLPLFFSFTLFYLSFKAITQKVPVFQEEPIVKELSSNAPDPQKEAGLKKQLSDLMEEKQPFLEPDLTLKDLANQMGIGRNQLSYLINNAFQSNFYLFVNIYRVEYLKKKMLDDKQKRFTILALAYDSGFNSKSSFNAIFKKITGLTPSEYRNRLS